MPSSTEGGELLGWSALDGVRYRLSNRSRARHVSVPRQDLVLLVVATDKARALVETHLAGLPLESYVEDLHEALDELGAWPHA